MVVSDHSQAETGVVSVLNECIPVVGIVEFVVRHGRADLVNLVLTCAVAPYKLQYIEKFDDVNNLPKCLIGSLIIVHFVGGIVVPLKILK